MAAKARNHRHVLFLDDDRDLREVVGTLLSRRGTRCETVGSVVELQRAFAKSDDFALVILDVNLGPGVPSGLDAYRWLRELGYRGRIAFLTGHARAHPLVAAASSHRDAAVIEKPISAKELVELVESA
jgi:DNA-binding NtrC family response regulator